MELQSITGEVVVLEMWWLTGRLLRQRSQIESGLCCNGSIAGAEQDQCVILYKKHLGLFPEAKKKKII